MFEILSHMIAAGLLIALLLAFIYPVIWAVVLILSKLQEKVERE